MPSIRPCDPPPDALLNRYADTGAYVDCYRADLARPVSHAEFVLAFYTTWVFRLERLILRWMVSRPSTDAEARQLAQGSADRFAAWSVEALAPNQLLLGFHKLYLRILLGAARSRLARNTKKCE